MADTEEKRMPRYAKPNMSSKLPANVGLEHEMIKAAFTPCSFTTIGDLGKLSLIDHADNGTSISDSALSFKSGPAKTYFTDFEYMSSPFDMASELKSQERKVHRDKMQGIGGDQPFVAPGVVHSAKYESTYSYEVDPYDTVRDETLRMQWMEERKVLSGPFIPSGRDKALSKPSRTALTDILSLIYRTLFSDWEELRPTVFTTAEDLIVVYFNVENAPKTEHGLLSYMNVLAKRSEITQRYDLRKVNEGWCIHTEDSHIMFAFRPPWVKEKRFTSFAKAESANAR